MAKKRRVPEGQVEELVKSGEFSFPAGSRVNVIGPERVEVFLLILFF